MAILHYQRLGQFGVNISDTWPMDDPDSHPDGDDSETTEDDQPQNIDEIAEDIADDESEGDDDDDEGTLDWFKWARDEQHQKRF
jgi:hypothetical protein